jgi:hypothetical protein
VNNYCNYPENTPGCPMTAAGSYCHPTTGAPDWVRGYNEHASACGA